METPAFGEWPLCEDYQMEGSAEKGRFRELLPLYVAMVASVLIGIGAIYFSSQWLQGVLKECVRDVGIALVTAAVLGGTVHIWLETNIVRDVFRAAVGHILPPELRDEVHWISSFKCLTYKCTCTLDIEDIGDGIVKVTEEVDSELKNITTKNQKIKRLFTKDDWGIPGKRAEIQYYEYVVGSGSPVKFDGIPERRRDMTVQVHMPDVCLRPGETVRTFARGIEFRRVNDVLKRSGFIQ